MFRPIERFPLASLYVADKCVKLTHMIAPVSPLVINTPLEAILVSPNMHSMLHSEREILSHRAFDFSAKFVYKEIFIILGYNLFIHFWISLSILPVVILCKQKGPSTLVDRIEELLSHLFFALIDREIKRVEAGVGGH